VVESGCSSLPERLPEPRKMCQLRVEVHSHPSWWEQSAKLSSLCYDRHLAVDKLPCLFVELNVIELLTRNTVWNEATWARTDNRAYPNTGRAMAQVVSRRPLTAEARVRARVNPCGICGGQSGTGTGSSPSSTVFPCQHHSTIVLHTHHRDYEQYVG
jgi:hypothetical protein